MAQYQFEPDYRNLVDAARRVRPRRLPLYEHHVHPSVLEQTHGKKFASLLQGDGADKREYFRSCCAALIERGYDTISWEGGITSLIQGGQALCGRAGPLFTCKKDIEAFDWAGLPDRYFKKFAPYFEALAASLPPGMMAVAGVGNGVFECIQDFVPMTDLAYLEADDPEGYDLLWKKVVDLIVAIWTRFIPLYGSAFCIFRMGDDLGFKSSLLIKPETIRTYVVPAYRRVVDLAHAAGKPFVLHSCGCIFDVMDDIIGVGGIDAKHSNEDAIAPFGDWLRRYGHRIALFGGIDMDLLCRETPANVERHVMDLLEEARPYPGFALGSGNQIADYVPPEGFIAMTEAVRRFRGDY